MSRRPHTRGVSLLECLVYLFVWSMLITVLGNMLLRGLYAAAAARRAVQAVQEAEITVELVCRDLREAADVLAPGPPGAPLSVQFPDDTVALYVLKDGTLTRYRLPEGSTSVGDSFATRALAAQFVQFEVTPVEGARRVYRIDLALRLANPFMVEEPAEPRVARFITAVQVRSEERP